MYFEIIAYLSLASMVACFLFNSVWPIIVLSAGAGAYALSQFL